MTIHWTAGRYDGDIATLDGPTVDCHFYVAKSGEVVQFLDMESMAWHGFDTANSKCLGIEHQGFGEAYTDAQLEASAKLVAYLCRRFGIPIRHVDPTAGVESSFRGIFGHRDLSLGGNRVDGNDHTDSVPDGTGWDRYLARVALYFQGGGATSDEVTPDPLPTGELRLAIQAPGSKPRRWADADAWNALRWMAANPLDWRCKVTLAFRGQVWSTERAPKRPVAYIQKVARTLVARHLDHRQEAA